MERNKVVLVDKQDQAIGEMGKLEAHQKGALHRAFSIFLFRKDGKLLLQQRASEKYHGADLWTNTCCSHPQIEEDLTAAAKERLSFEMGITGIELQWIYRFIYHSPVENKLIEHELDHVFIGYYEHDPEVNPNEVRDYKWLNPEEILEDIQRNPAQYTVWFKQAFPELLTRLANKQNPVG